MPKPLPRIKVLTTGGTIAGRPEPGLGYRAGAIPASQLLKSVPGATALAEIEIEVIADVGSQDVDHGLWDKLARRLQELMRDTRVSGVVVTHGTDTLEETAFVLHLVLEASKPVVLTGAMRPPHDLGADGPANLLSAIKVAAQSSLGVCVVMNESIFDPVQVQKHRAEGLEAFCGRNHGAMGRLTADGLRLYFGANFAPALQARFTQVSLADTPYVPILYVHAGMHASVLTALLQQDCAGIVVAGVGNGNAPAQIWTHLAAAAVQGVAVVRSTRTAAGYVMPNVEVNDASNGFIASGGLSPQKACILLQLALAQGLNHEEIQNLFLSI